MAKFQRFSSSKQTKEWITHLYTKMPLKQEQSIQFSLREKLGATTFDKAWLDIRVIMDGTSTGIGITINSTELAWLSHTTFEATESDFSEPMTTMQEFGKRSLTFEHCKKGSYEYIKISQQKEQSKIRRLCIPKSDIEEFLDHLRSFRCVFKYSTFYESAKLLWGKKIILIMVAGASLHPCFTLGSQQMELDAVLDFIAKSQNILLPRFFKALQFLGFADAPQLQLQDIEFTEEDWKLAKAMKCQDSTMGATKNELLLARHAVFLFKNTMLDHSKIQ